MKKNKLYTINKYNRALANAVNVFGDGGPEDKTAGQVINNPLYNSINSNTLSVNSDPFGINKGAQNQISNIGTATTNLGNAGAKAIAKGSLMRAIGRNTNGLGSIMSTTSNIVGGLMNKAFSNGLSTKAGSAVSSIGSTVGGAIGSVNPFLGAAVTVGSGIIGGAINGAIGYKLKGDKEVNAWLDSTKNITFGGNNDTIEEQLKGLKSVGTVTAQNGWATSAGTKAAAEKNNLVARREELIDRSKDNAILNNVTKQQRNMDALYHAFGGPIGGAIDYGLMSDYITVQNNQAQGRNKITSMPNSFSNPTLFADGGKLQGVDQTHGAVFDNGANYIGTGGSHEQNPNKGVQIGTDSEGTPNLVEEGEVIWNDFVFSNRIEVPQDVKRSLGIRAKKSMSFADVAQILQKESKERPNDPISKAGLNANLEQLANAQETLKQKAEQEKAAAEFAALPPEKQAALIQQMQTQQQAQQQQAQQEQMMAQEQSQQQIQQDSSVATGENAAWAEPQPYAYGGNLYPDGGTLIDLFKTLGFATSEDAAKAGFTPQDFGLNSWSDMNAATVLPDNFTWNTAWNSRLSQDLQNRLKVGWTPYSKPLEQRWFEDYAGNAQGWSPSYNKSSYTADEFNELAKRYDNTIGYAVRNGLLKVPTDGNTISAEDIVKVMRNTPRAIATDKWLFDDPNALRNQESYLGRVRKRAVMDDGTADEKFINKWSQYGDFTQNSDGTYSYKYKDNLTDAQKNEVKDLWNRSRWNDNWIGLMYDSFSDPEQLSTNYTFDSSGNPIVLASTDGYRKVGSSFQWADEKNFRNNLGQFWEKVNNNDKDNTSNSANSTDPKSKRYRDVEPIHKADWMRYAGVFGPAVGLGMQLAGVGKPDTSRLDAIANSQGVAPIMADYRPIGDYLTYTPLDRDRYANKLNAQAGATRRAILNSSSSPSRSAAILAADNNFQNKLGEALLQGEDYNWNRKKDVGTFNRGTNQFNAEAFNRAALQYASDYNNQRRFSAQLQAEAARQKMDADSQWYQGIYGNIGQIASGLSGVGKENAQHNILADLAAQGAYGVMDPDQPFASNWVRHRTISKFGGKFKKKKGGLV